ncbi:hypothetical protein JW905_07700, partial [bacterium]|nr:hypothetical protein [candidate division CSSED10-310 bacterium]
MKRGLCLILCSVVLIVAGVPIAQGASGFYLDDSMVRRATETVLPTNSPVPPTSTPTATATVNPGMCPDNLLENPGFEIWDEYGPTGPPDEWVESGAGLTATRENTLVFNGSYSTRIDWTSTSTVWLYQPIPVVGGETYDFRIRVFDNDTGGRCRAYISYYTTEGGLIGSTGGDYSNDSADWQLLELLDIVTPATTAYIEFQIRAYDIAGWPGSAVVYVDNVEYCGLAPLPTATATLAPPTNTPVAPTATPVPPTGTPVPPAIDWCNLQFPAVTYVLTGGASELIFGQVYIDGITIVAGATSGLVAHLGFGPDGSDPAVDTGWTWLPAVFNVDSGNNDEFMGQIYPTAAGVYDMAYRYSYLGGGFCYGDLDGSGNGYDPGQAGQLIVTDPTLVPTEVPTPPPPTATPLPGYNIGDYIWNDLDGNGQQNEGIAVGLNGVTVRLYEDENGNGVIDATDDVLNTVVTGDGVNPANGYYLFTDVQPATYIVDVDESTLPPGYQLTTATEPYPVLMLFGDNLNIDFGYWLVASPTPVYSHTPTNTPTRTPTAITPMPTATQPPATGTPVPPTATPLPTATCLTSIGDLVWYDANGDGIANEDISAFGLNGISVFLLYDINCNGQKDTDDQLLLGTTTSFDPVNALPGWYEFNLGAPGCYLVEVDTSTLPPEYEMTSSSNPYPVLINPCDIIDTIDFGFWVPPTPSPITTTVPTATPTEVPASPTPVGPVVINEIYYDDPSTDDASYVELFGPPGASLNGFAMEPINQSCAVQCSVTMEGEVIPADGFFVIGMTGVTNVDLVADSCLSNLQNGPCDGVLLTYFGVTVDALQFGSGCDPLCGEGLPVAEPSDIHSLSRISDGADSNDNS